MLQVYCCYGAFGSKKFKEIWGTEFLIPIMQRQQKSPFQEYIFIAYR